MTQKPALLVMGHGTKDEQGTKEFFDLLTLTTKLRPDVLVVGGFIEFAKPTINEAVSDLVKTGTRSIVVVPLVLLGATHQKNDGPALVSFGKEISTNVSFTYARPLGIHPKILNIVKDSIKGALANLSPGEKGVLIVGRGSTDPDANSDLYKIARLLSDDPDIGRIVEPSFISLTDPSVKQGLERLSSLSFNKIAVVPYFLFDGILVQRIYDQALQYGLETKTEIFNGKHIGAKKEIGQLIWERYDEALAGSAYMNCDLCAYRFPMSGYEYKLEKS